MRSQTRQMWTNFGDRAFSAAGHRVRNSLLMDLRQPDLSHSHCRNFSGIKAQCESLLKCALEILLLTHFQIQNCKQNKERQHTFWCNGKQGSLLERKLIIVLCVKVIFSDRNKMIVYTRRPATTIYKQPHISTYMRTNRN